VDECEQVISPCRCCCCCCIWRGRWWCASPPRDVAVHKLRVKEQSLCNRFFTVGRQGAGSRVGTGRFQAMGQRWIPELVQPPCRATTARRWTCAPPAAAPKLSALRASPPARPASAPRRSGARCVCEIANFVGTGYSRWVKGQAQGLQQGGFKLWVNFQAMGQLDSTCTSPASAAICALPMVSNAARVDFVSAP
jgi:hypothetical protein